MTKEEIKNILILDCRDKENRKTIKKYFKKCNNYEELEKLSTSDITQEIANFLKKNDFQLINTMYYVEGAHYILIDYRLKRTDEVKGMSIKEIYIKCYVYANACKMKGIR